MALINFTERCVSHDIFGYFEKLGIHFQIVEEVKKEFFKKVKPLGEARFKTYTRNNILQTISNDDIEIDLETMNDFVNKGFGKVFLYAGKFSFSVIKFHFLSPQPLLPQWVLKKKRGSIIIKP